MFTVFFLNYFVVNLLPVMVNKDFSKLSN